MTIAFTPKELYELTSGQLRILANYLKVEGDTKDELVKNIYEELKKQNTPEIYYQEPVIPTGRSVRIQRILDSQKGE